MWRFKGVQVVQVKKAMVWALVVVKAARKCRAREKASEKGGKQEENHPAPGNLLP